MLHAERLIFSGIKVSLVCSFEKRLMSASILFLSFCFTLESWLFHTARHQTNTFNFFFFFLLLLLWVSLDVAGIRICAGSFKHAKGENFTLSAAVIAADSTARHIAARRADRLQLTIILRKPANPKKIN